MALRDILIWPHDVLTTVCEPLEAQAADRQGLIRDMGETMFDANGVGLAAPQIGVSERLFIIEPEVAGRESTEPPMVFIDPEIVELSDEKAVEDEGCLSFPGVYVPVERSVRCKTRALNERGEPFEVEGEGLFARAMQHENDHLDGKLISDHVGPLKRKLIKRRLARETAGK